LPKRLARSISSFGPSQPISVNPGFVILPPLAGAVPTGLA
jgi:hypothetical protein